MTHDEILARLAALHGIAPDHHDAMGRHHTVSQDTRRALLAAFGAPAGTEGDAADSLARVVERRFGRAVDPAVVSAEGDHPVLRLGPAFQRCPSVYFVVAPEDERTVAERVEGRIDLHGAAPAPEAAEAGFQNRHVTLPVTPPAGCYRAILSGGGTGPEASLRLLVGPRRCHLPDAADGDASRHWGVGVQLYGLRSRHNGGIGDYGDLAGLSGVAAAEGAAALGVSPVHALFAADPGHFGPYGPSSRIFLNVMHIDVARAAAMLGQPVPDAAVHTVPAAADSQVDYPAVAAWKMPALETLFAAFREGPAEAEPVRRFQAYCADAGVALDRFALFEALHAHFFGQAPAHWDWRSWPDGFRGPERAEARAYGTAHPDRVDFHRFLQWLADTQLAAVHAAACAGGMAIGLYRDLAIGTHPGGAAAWADPEVMPTGIGVGAPPDALNYQGQAWGVTALSPAALLERGFQPFLDAIAANMRHAGALRIDHVMGLQRLYWVPEGAPADQGAYVAYPFEAMRRLLALQSQRHGCLVVGEDLGSVPDGFREAMREDGVLTYSLLYFERREDGRFARPEEFPGPSLVAASTHDLPTLRGWLKGRDIDWRAEVGQIVGEESVAAEWRGRHFDRDALLRALTEAGLLADGEEDPDAITAAAYRYLARTPARLLMVQAEDLTGEIEQPNLPGTVHEHPNWRRRLAESVETLLTSDRARAVVKAMAAEGRGR